MNEPSIFTQIINGDIPAHKIYEDDKTVAFMDINPVQPGHVLVVPKVEVEFVWDLDESDYTALMRTVQLVARRVREIMGRPYVGEMIVGTDVPHAHVHVIPFTEVHELKRVLNEDFEPDQQEIADIAERLKMS